MHHRIPRSLCIALFHLLAAVLLLAAAPSAAAQQTSAPVTEETGPLVTAPAGAPAAQTGVLTAQTGALVTAPANAPVTGQPMPATPSLADVPSAREQPIRSILLRPDGADSGQFLPAEAYAGREFPTFLTPRHTAGNLHVETERGVLSLHMPADDPWLSFDKLQHFTFSFLITVGCQYGLVNKLSVSEGRALPLSITTSATVGLTKEYYDLRYGRTRTFSKRDLIANATGIVVAAGFILL